MATIPHANLSAAERHPPKSHPLVGQFDGGEGQQHTVSSNDNGKIVTVVGGQLVFATLASFLSEPPGGIASNGAIWYDDANDRFLCRRGGETHVLVTTKIEE